MLLSVLLLAAGLGTLFLGGNWFVDGAAGLARMLRVRPLIVGLVVIGFGTSLPEMLVSLFAVADGRGGIAIGNMIGSNIANIGLVMAVAALIYPLAVHKSILRIELPLTALVTMLFALLIGFDANLGSVDGILLLAAFGLSLAYILGFPFLPGSSERSAKQLDLEAAELVEESPLIVPARSPIVAGVQTVVGLALILIGAQLTVDNAAGIARQFGVSDAVIGLTLVAVGTSLPELAAGVIAAWKRHTDLIIGNVLGSNLYNLGFIGGFVGLLSGDGLHVEDQLRIAGLIVMLVLTFLLLPVLRRGFSMYRWEGAVIVTGYFVYTVLLF